MLKGSEGKCNRSLSLSALRISLFQKCFSKCVAIKIAVFLKREVGFLTSESVESSALSFQSIDDIHSGDGLSLGVLGVGDCVSDNIFQENLENSTSFFVD